MNNIREFRQAVNSNWETILVIVSILVALIFIVGARTLVSREMNVAINQNSIDNAYYAEPIVEARTLFEEGDLVGMWTSGGNDVSSIDMYLSSNRSFSISEEFVSRRGEVITQTGKWRMETDDNYQYLIMEFDEDLAVIVFEQEYREIYLRWGQEFIDSRTLRFTLGEVMSLVNPTHLNVAIGWYGGLVHKVDED
jgi:hypothetical protein